MKIPEHNYTIREATVVSVLKDLDYDISTWHNIGFHNWQDPRSHWWIKICYENKVDWQITEIFEPSVTEAIDHGCPAGRIWVGNILETETYPNSDLLIFWHGPEHILKEEFLAKLPEIEKKANKLIIFGMPDGFEPQGATKGNEWQNHISGWTVSEWHELGYETLVTSGHITAYKHL